MKNSKEKKFNSKIFMMIFIIIIAIIVFSCILFFNNYSRLSDFEKFAIYRHIGNSLDVTTLYSLSGDSSYDPLAAASTQIKIFLDDYTFKNNTDIVPASEVRSVSSVDYHGVLISDYEYIPEQDVFQKSIGANSNMKLIESSYNSHNDESVIVTDMNKTSNSSYDISFNIVNSSSEDSVLKSGHASITINEDNSFDVTSCSLEN